MSFFAYEFIFNNISSDKYALLITSTNDGGISDSPLITETNLILEKAAQNSRYYQIGTSTKSLLTFPIEFYSEKPIYAYDREQIAHWLSGEGQLRKLRIIQDDMSSIYYNCYFSKIDWTNISNIGYGFKATVVCDAAFAWKNEIKVKKVNQSTGNVDGAFLYPDQTKFTIVNTSTDFNPISPSILIFLGDSNNKVTVTNKSNQNQSFTFSELQNGEEISISEEFIMESISNPNKIIVDNFEGEFFELIQGRNDIVVDGQIREIHFAYHPSKMIGG